MPSRKWEGPLSASSSLTASPLSSSSTAPKERWNIIWRVENGSCAARSIFFNCHQSSAHHQIANQGARKLTWTGKPGATYGAKYAAKKLWFWKLPSSKEIKTLLEFRLEWDSTLYLSSVKVRIVTERETELDMRKELQIHLLLFGRCLELTNVSREHFCNTGLFH